jgi:uncharacterized protein
MTLTETKQIEKTKRFVENWMRKDFSGHDYYHVMRVYETALYLSEDADVDLFIVQMAALLHDVVDPKLKKPHAKVKHPAEWMKSIKLDDESITKIM